MSDRIALLTAAVRQANERNTAREVTPTGKYNRQTKEEGTDIPMGNTRALRGGGGGTGWMKEEKRGMTGQRALTAEFTPSFPPFLYPLLPFSIL